MKKITIALFFLLVIVVSLITFKHQQKNKTKELITNEQIPAIINNYYIYGTKLNIEGTISNINPKFIRGDLVLINKNKKIIYKINYTKGINNISFNISDEINNGLYLDYIPKGKFTLYIRLTYQEKGIEKNKYYSLKNNTKYKKTTYYTLSKTNNKILINTKDNNFIITITNNKNKAYDIVIDPSRGGVDVGTTGNGYKESDITMNFAEKIKNNLEKKGIKVKLTRTKNSLKKDEYLNEYNKHGRAIIPYEVHAKYVFSLHTNSSSSTKTNGISIYTSSNINYEFSTNIVENITNNTTIKPANYNIYSIDYGVYSHNYTKSDIEENKKEYINKGYKMYNITNKSNYLYMIRETGGIITGAYIDNRNKEIGYNPYYNSNIGSESYVIYLGYLTNKNDLNMLVNNQEQYAKLLSDTIIKELEF